MPPPKYRSFNLHFNVGMEIQTVRPNHPLQVSLFEESNAGELRLRMRECMRNASCPAVAVPMI
eukprot:scaffold1186_cov80-Cylindrotheca_fusiformis.AAC.2